MVSVQRCSSLPRHRPSSRPRKTRTSPPNLIEARTSYITPRTNRPELWPAAAWDDRIAANDLPCTLASLYTRLEALTHFFSNAINAAGAVRSPIAGKQRRGSKEKSRKRESIWPIDRDPGMRTITTLILVIRGIPSTMITTNIASKSRR